MERNDANGQNPNRNLDSTEYRASLLRKLNCLISVVEVALAKVRANLQAPGADLERLTRIRLNLENTLNVCRRAKLALERREPMPAGLPGEIASLTAKAAPPSAKPQPGANPKISPIGPDGRPAMSYRDYVEFSSLGEYQKFKTLPAIRLEEVKKVNLDDLARKLGGVDKTA